MQEQFVTYEIALELKKLGFDEVCLAAFINIDNSDKNELEIGGIWRELSSIEITKAPLWQQVFDWLRKDHSLYITITSPDDICQQFYYEIFRPHVPRTENSIKSKSWDSYNKFSYRYEDAREKAILKSIEIVTNKNA